MAEFTDLIDLAAERLGGAVLLANDEFFAAKESLIKASAPEWREGVYNERGKWMDGWETRRRREPGHDWCIVRLGLPGMLKGVDVDTSFFRGNFPESCSIDGCSVPPATDAHLLSDDAITPWAPILRRTKLEGHAHNTFPIRSAGGLTHVRLNIYPDGGVARFRVYGAALFDPGGVWPGGEVDLAAVEHGGFVVVCSDMFFGHRQNLIMPGFSTHMDDGWETRRRRGPGHDWAIVRLATRGVVHRVELDTDHFKGNAPGACAVELCDAPRASAKGLSDKSRRWAPLLERTPLQPHTRHRFTDVAGHAPATHARLNIYPDGGVARLRLFGRPRAER